MMNLTLEQFNVAVDYSMVKYKVTYLEGLFGDGCGFFVLFYSWLVVFTSNFCFKFLLFRCVSCLRYRI